MEKREQEIRDFPRLTNAVGRYFASQDLHVFRGETVIHLRVDDAAGDGVYLDAAGSQLLCQCFCEGVYAALGGGVGNFHGGACISPDGGDVDDFPGMAFHHGSFRSL